MLVRRHWDPPLKTVFFCFTALQLSVQITIIMYLINFLSCGEISIWVSHSILLNPFFRNGALFRVLICDYRLISQPALPLYVFAMLAFCLYLTGFRNCSVFLLCIEVRCVSCYEFSALLTKVLQMSLLFDWDNLNMSLLFWFGSVSAKKMGSASLVTLCKIFTICLTSYSSSLTLRHSLSLSLLRIKKKSL